MIDRICKFIASLFCIGYIPVAPGTLGSFVALFFYFFVKDYPELIGPIILISFILGILTAGRAEQGFGGKDSSEIIIDEFVGMLVSLYLLPVRFGYIVWAFLLFRFFDIVKPFPVNRLEELSGGLGIMLDDIMAGVYTNLILHGVHLLFFIINRVWHS